MKKMSNPYYLVGNTIRMYGTFFHMENENDVVQPDEVTLNIFDYKWDLIDSFIVGLENYLDASGAYYYDYVFGDVGTYYFEWKGLINGLPSVEREKLKIRHI